MTRQLPYPRVQPWNPLVPANDSQPLVAERPETLDLLQGRFGSLALRQDEVGQFLRKALEGSQRPLRIGYYSAIVDFDSALDAWSRGSPPRAFSIPYGLQLLDLADALGAEVFALDFNLRSETRQVGSFYARKLTVPGPGGGLIDNARRTANWTRALAAGFERFEPDFTIIGGGLAWPLARALPGRVIRSQHINLWQPDRKNPSWKERARLAPLQLLGRGKADAAVSVSEVGADQLRQLVGDLPIHLALAQTPEKVLPRPTPVPRVPRLLFMGRMNDHKGPHELLAAAIRLKRECPELTLSYVGGGSDLDLLRRRIAESGAEGWVETHGWVDRRGVRREIDRASLIVCPTRRDHIEGQPRVLLEAHMLGRPAVASSVCPTTARDSTLIYDVDNPDGLFCALKEAVLDPTVSLKLKAAAQAGREVYTDRSRSWGTQIFRAMQSAIEG